MNRKMLVSERVEGRQRSVGGRKLLVTRVSHRWKCPAAAAFQRGLCFGPADERPEAHFPQGSMHAEDRFLSPRG